MLDPDLQANPITLEPETSWAFEESFGPLPKIVHLACFCRAEVRDLHGERRTREEFVPPSLWARGLACVRLQS